MNRLTVAGELNRLQKVAKNAKDIDEETLDIYLEDLADLPTDLVIQALGELRKSITFFPSIGEIRDRVVAIAGQSVLVDAESAWGEVMREVRRVGIEGKRTSFMNGESRVIAVRTFSSPMIEKAVDAIGWEAFCMVNPEKASEVNTLRAQLRDTIRVIQKREIDQIVSGRAIGAGFHALSDVTISVLPIGEGPDA